MGVAYNVIAAGAVNRYPFAVECLKHYEIDSASASASNNNPSPLELRAVLDDLTGYATDYQVSPGNWQALVEATTGLKFLRPGTLVCVVDYQGDETKPHIFYFDKGDLKLNILIVERLSRLCGPFYIFPDTGAKPLLVTPGTDPTKAVKEWKIG